MAHTFLPSYRPVAREVTIPHLSFKYSSNAIFPSMFSVILRSSDQGDTCSTVIFLTNLFFKSHLQLACVTSKVGLLPRHLWMFWGIRCKSFESLFAKQKMFSSKLCQTIFTSTGETFVFFSSESVRSSISLFSKLML